MRIALLQKKKKYVKVIAMVSWRMYDRKNHVHEMGMVFEEFELVICMNKWWLNPSEITHM